MFKIRAKPVFVFMRMILLQLDLDLSVVSVGSKLTPITRFAPKLTIVLLINALLVSRERTPKRDKTPKWDAPKSRSNCT